MSIITDLAGARAALVDAATKLVAVVGGGATGIGSLVETAAGMIRTLARLQAEVKPVAHSTSSVTIGTGSKSFTIGEDTYLPEEGEFRISSDADRTNFMAGSFYSLVDGVLTIDVKSMGGDGTYADWTIRPIGERGAGGNTGPSGESRATAVRVATTANVAASAIVDGATVDGVKIHTDDLVLVHLQTANGGAANGIRRVPASGDAPRAVGFENYDDHPGLQVTVLEGATYGGQTLVCYSPRGGTLDTTPIKFGQLPPMQQLVYPREPMPVDGGFLFVPPLYYFNKADGFQLVTPPNDARYWKLQISTSATVAYRHYYDEAARASGNTPIVTVSSTNLPTLSGWRKPLIATSINGTVTSEHPVVGDRRGGIGSNQFLEGNDPDRAGFVYPEGTVVDITDAALIALGFTRGVKATSGGYNSFYGAELPRKLVGNEFAFPRVYVQADTPNAFGIAGLYAYRGGNAIGPLALTLEEKLSTTAAIYSVAGQLGSVAGADKIAVGSKGSAGNAVTVCGVQWCIAQRPVPWIARQDYPTNDLPEPVLGPDLFLVKNRPLPLYVPSALRMRTDDHTFVASFGSVDAGNANRPFAREGRQIMLEGEKMGATSELWIHPPNRDLNRSKRMVFTNHIANDSGLAAAPKLHFNVDSIGNRALLAAIATKLAALGITSPEWIGTIETSTDSSPTGTGGPLAEAREGRAFSDLIYSILDGEATPLPPGQEGYYGGLTKAQKLAYNLYIREAHADASACTIAGTTLTVSGTVTRLWRPGQLVAGSGVTADSVIVAQLSGTFGGAGTYQLTQSSAVAGPTALTATDPAAKVKNGHVFDFGFYLNRFSFPIPDIVGIKLGRNDELESSPSQSLLTVQTALPIVVPSIREAGASIKIGLGMSTIANTTDGRERYGESIALVAALNSYVRQLGDNKVYMVNAHAHVSADMGWTMAASPAVDVATGIQYAPIIDSTHPGPFNVEQTAESWAAFIANVA